MKNGPSFTFNPAMIFIDFIKTKKSIYRQYKGLVAGLGWGLVGVF